MKDSKSKSKVGLKKPTELHGYSFEEAMRQIVNVQKIDVAVEIKKVKKKPRGKNSIRE